jgi:hypothetical protein
MTNYLRFTVFFILIFTGILFSQWSTDPNNTLIVGYGLNPELCSDSAGGCYITYEYGTTGYPRKLAVERLDKYGYKPWETLKQVYGELEEQWQAQIIEDDEGGVIISYFDDTTTPNNSTYRVRVQRVDSAGNLLWGPTGVRISTEEITQGVQRLVSDGNGGCIVVWPNELQNYTYDYRANRINNLGERAWGDTGIFLENSIYSQPASIVKGSDGSYYVLIRGNLYRISPSGEIIRSESVTSGYIVPDDEGGIVLSSRIWTGMISKLVAQRKDSLGNNLWQEPYVEIADSLYINSPINIKQINGNYYYNWYGTKNGIELVLQYQAVRPDGSLLFAQGSQPISDYPVDALFGGMLPSDSGTLVFVWQDYRPDDGVFGQRIDTLGNKLWNMNDVQLFTGACADLYSTTDCNGGAIVLGWHQYNFSMRAFKVSKYGNLGEVIIPVELISFNAEVAGKAVKLSWLTATETNNKGFAVERFAESLKSGWVKIGFIQGNGTTTEPKSYSFTDIDVAEGIYKYRLKQIDYDGSYKYSKEVEVNVTAPNKFSLEQNYPNPFNPTTTIKYAVPKAVNVELKVYDILGREVKTLVNAARNPGYYEVQFNAVNLASGVYFYRLKAGDYIKTSKMLLLK